MALVVLMCGAASADAAETQKWCSDGFDKPATILFGEERTELRIGGNLQPPAESESGEGEGGPFIGADLYFYGEGERGDKQDVIIYRDRVFWPCDEETSADQQGNNREAEPEAEADAAAGPEQWCFETSVLIMTDTPVIKTPGRADEHLDPKIWPQRLTINYLDSETEYTDIQAMRYHDRVFWPCCKTWPCGVVSSSFFLGPKQELPPEPRWFYHLQACEKCDIELVSYDTAVRCESSRQERLAEGLKTGQYCFGKKDRPPSAEIQLKKSKTWDQDP